MSETNTPAPEDPGKRLFDMVDSWDEGAVKTLCNTWGSRGEVMNWANPNKHGWTPLHRACVLPNITKMLLGTDAIEVNKGDNNGVTPLWLAAFNYQHKTVKALLAFKGTPGIDINKVPNGDVGSNTGKTPLAVANEGVAKDDDHIYAYEDVVKLLNDAGNKAGGKKKTRKSMKNKGKSRKK